MQATSHRPYQLNWIFRQREHEIPCDEIGLQLLLFDFGERNRKSKADGSDWKDEQRRRGKADPSGVDYEHYNITNNDEEIDTGKKTYEIHNHSQDVNDVNMDNDDDMNIHFNNSSHHSDNNNISSDS